MLALVLVAGYFMLFSLLSPGTGSYAQKNKATLRVKQLSSTKTERSVLYEIVYNESLNKPSEAFQVTYDNNQMSQAVRFKSLLPKSSLVKLGQKTSELETVVFAERQRRLKEVEDHLNRSLTNNPARIKLSVNADGVNLDIYTPRHAQNNNPAKTKAAEESVRGWAEQTLAPYRNYILDIRNDQNFLAPHLRDINKIIPPNYYSLKMSDDYMSLEMIPNYAGVSQASQLALYPLARELYDKAPAKDARSLVQQALTFVQAMPSAQLSQRRLDGSAAENFSSPADCLTSNSCGPDSKAVLMATLLAVMVPQTPVIMTQTHYDSFIGVPLQPTASDTTYELSGLTFVLSDPSSGEMTPVGQINSQAFTGATQSAFTNVAIISGY